MHVVIVVVASVLVLFFVLAAVGADAWGQKK
jgi:hypothetical protein